MNSSRDLTPTRLLEDLEIDDINSILYIWNFLHQQRDIIDFDDTDFEESEEDEDEEESDDDEDDKEEKDDKEDKEEKEEKNKEESIEPVTESNNNNSTTVGNTNKIDKKRLRYDTSFKSVMVYIYHMPQYNNSLAIRLYNYFILVC